MTLTRRALLAAAAALPALGGCKAQAAVPSLGDLAAARGVVFGAAIEPQAVDGDPAFAALLREQCRLFTPENAMKWNALRPGPQDFDFTAADRVVDIARAQKAGVHGHCLVWHEANPAWLTAAITPANAEHLLTDHITAVAGRYAGWVGSWDVVNEAVERNDHRPDGLRRSIWLQALGPGYLDLAFHTAQAAAPQAKLMLADYGLEYDTIGWMVEKRGTMLALLEGLLQRGVPIQALALQSHLEGDREPGFGRPLADFLRQVAGLGLDICITELDVNDQKVPGDVARRDRVVADNYARYLGVVLNQPAVKLVNTWGLSDRYTSKASMFARPDGARVRPLPFDDALAPKAAYEAMVGAFRR
jgi:endo-1,4-beta-xylanase